MKAIKKGNKDRMIRNKKNICFNFKKLIIIMENKNNRKLKCIIHYLNTKI